MKTTVVTSYGESVDYPAVVSLMDDDIREDIHHALAPCTPQKFYDAYCRAHLDFFGEVFAPDNPVGCW